MKSEFAEHYLTPDIRSGYCFIRLFAMAAAGLILTCAAQAEVQMDARVGFGQSAVNLAKYRLDTWTPVTIYLSGQGARGIGQLKLIERHGSRTFTYTRHISLHEGPLNEAQGFVFQYPQNDNFTGGINQPELSAQLIVDGREIGHIKKIPLPLYVASESFNILALTKDGSGMNFLAKKKLGLFHHGVNPATLLSNRGGNGQQNSTPIPESGINPNAISELLYSDPRSLPAMAQGYEMIDAIALADFLIDNLTEDQVEALRGFVRRGGLLIISGGSDLSRLKSQFYSEMLPIVPKASVVAREGSPDISQLEQRYKSFDGVVSLGIRDGLPLTSGSLRDGAETLFGSKSSATGYGLVAKRAYGNGVVVFTAFDFLSQEIRGWRQAPSMWHDLLQTGNNTVSPRAILENNANNNEGGRYGNNNGDSQSTLSKYKDALAGKQATNVPPFNFVGILLGLYIVLLIPVSYFVLKKLDKRDFAWFTAPLIILGFSAASFIMALAIKGGLLTVNRAVVLESLANSDQAACYAQLSLYSPSRSEYDITFGAQNDPNAPSRGSIPGEIFATGSSNANALNIEHQGSSSIHKAEISLWSKRSFDLPLSFPLGGPVQVAVKMVNEKDAEVTITNRTRYTIHQCGLANDAEKVISLDDLAPGETKKGTIPWIVKGAKLSLFLPKSPNGWAASYAPDNTSPVTEDQTQKNIRYWLINNLTTQRNTNDNQFAWNGMGNSGPETYGRVDNVFYGWLGESKQPVLELQVNGKPVAGEEAALLYVHLPMPEGAPEKIAKVYNPFLNNAVPVIEEELLPGAKRNNGLYR